MLNHNGVVLLHGPPGSGKTTLCKALAQKVTIRQSKSFTGGRLVEVNCQELLSRWFGESAKRLSKLFDDIATMAEEDDGENLVCVLFDEVETLARARELTGDTPDAMRVTNQLLTCLSNIKEKPNILVLCTSNLFGVLDKAFLDRCDVVQEIPGPGQGAAYVIFAQCLNTLLDIGQVVFPDLCDVHYVENCGSCKRRLQPRFPNPSEVRVRFRDLLSTPQNYLWRIAEASVGLSGRNMRRLPVQALTKYTYITPRTVQEALSALHRLVTEEKIKPTL
ncbi:thyroid receptor-interacting protein 13 [Rhizodiscina lignyota]|uniref:Thyroid receptor-interacting protein 13 n=1 Tax=Rhizodiscina lignyota TaxID=1504668 RepID=A0A9P4I378_9PEZI|nr:thyroid receptor-interacting protein 13 [Rhizodiscina lignyota]